MKKKIKESLSNKMSSCKAVGRDINCCTIPRTKTLRVDGMGLCGFTLMELLIVVLIIGILTATAVPMYEKATRKAQFANVQTTLTTLMRDLDMYAMENGYETVNLQTTPTSATFKTCYTSGKYICTTEEGEWWLDGKMNIVFRPNKDQLANNPYNATYIFSKSMGSPWTWTNNTSLQFAIAPTYNETFQMFCDWWINTGGKPVSGKAQTTANEQCK